jgi:hypothetical protein
LRRGRVENHHRVEIRRILRADAENCSSRGGYSPKRRLRSTRTRTEKGVRNKGVRNVFRFNKCAIPAKTIA